ncbi:hypothetical protein MASR2M117_09580 [Paludibacter sp.]
MNTLKNYLVGFLVLFVSQVWAQGGKQKLVFSLEECIAFALENSNNQQSLYLDKAYGEAGLKQSKQEWLPQVYGTASQGFNNYNSAPIGGTNPSWSGNYAINAGMTVWNGGQINLNVKQNRLMTELNNLQIEQAENQLTIRVIQAFLSVIGYDELLKFQQEALILSKMQAEKGKVKLTAGQILESDYLLLEAQLAGDKYNIVNSENARNNNMLALYNLLSLRSGQSLEIVAPDHNEIKNMTIIPDLNTVVELALRNLPELRISQQNIELAKNSVKLAATAYYPSLSLNAGIGSGYASGSGNFENQLSNRFNQNVTLNMNIPIYSKGKTKSSVQQYKIREEQAILRHDQTKLDIAQQVETEYQNIVAISNKYNTAEIKFNATAASYNAYEKQFDAGSITVTDLLLQKNNHINAFTDMVQSKYSYILERKILDIYMGQ